MKKIWNWLKKAFTVIEKDVDKVAITVTQHIKDDLDNGVLGFIATTLAGVLHSQVPIEIVALLKMKIPKILAVELAIQGIPDNATDQDILEFEQRVLDAFGVNNQKSKLYTVLASQIYLEVKTLMNEAHGVTFAEAVKLIEDSYTLYLKDKADIGE